MNIPEHVPVLIAGAGPVGSALALELARRGVQALLVDPRAQVAEHEAHGNGISHRTFEYYRRWGVAQAMREVASFHSAPGQVRFGRYPNSTIAHRLAGYSRPHQGAGADHCDSRPLRWRLP